MFTFKDYRPTECVSNGSNLSEPLDILAQTGLTFGKLNVL